MPATPQSGLRYPSSSAAPNVAQDIQNLATDLDTRAIPRFTSTAARATAIPSPVEGQMSALNGKPEMYRGGRWRPASPLTATTVRSYGSGARILPGNTFTDSNALVLTNLVVGQPIKVRVEQNIRVDGNTVQTITPGLSAPGSTATYSLSMTTRVQPATDAKHDQYARDYLLTATSSTVTLSPTVTNGLGVPDLIVDAAGIIATLVDTL